MPALTQRSESRSAALGLALVLLLCTDALAGAWTQAKGHGLAITTVTVSRASDGFDDAGAVIETPEFRKEDYELYGEYGLTPRLTSFLHARYTNLHPAPPSTRSSGLGEGELGLRYGVYSGKLGVISLQASLFAPGNTVLTSGGADGEIRLNLGSSFKLFRRSGFLDSGFAWRGRTNNVRDELHADFTIGYDLSPGWQLLAQSFSILAIGPGRTTAFAGQTSKAQLSVLYRFSPHWAVQLGGLATVCGTGVPRERGGIAALWYRF